jgi:prepilin-type N-terminal cleavage/methylation domain-containing protein
MTPLTRKKTTMKTRAQKGFTLAELLIALAILGVIATFTIPKILTSTGTAQFIATTKEAASILSGAQQDFMVNNALTTSTTVDALFANVNYVAVSTATAAQSGLQETCGATNVKCLQLHNGAILQYKDNQTFGATTNYVTAKLDPDGAKGAATTDIVTFALYYNGQLRDLANATGTQAGSGLTAQANATPTWATNLWTK